MSDARARTALLTAFALVMFAANSLLCRMALGPRHIDGASYTGIRIASGALALLLILRLRQPAARVGGDWPSALSLFLYAAPFSFAYNGLTTGTGALILFGCVQLTMLVAAWRAGERPSTLQWSGLLIAVAGLVYLLLPGLEAPPVLPAALMALAGVAWGVYSIRGRGAGDPLQRTTGNFIRAVPLAVAVSLAAWGSIAADASGIVLAAASGALASAIGYVAWYAALKHLSSARAAVVQLLVPILAAVAGVLVLAEPFGIRLALAAALVLGGVALTLRKKAR